MSREDKIVLITCIVLIATSASMFVIRKKAINFQNLKFELDRSISIDEEGEYCSFPYP